VLTSSLIRQDLVPMVASYLVLMAALGIGLRGLQRPRDARRAAAPDATGRGSIWPALIRYMIGTAVGGYLTLSVVVVAYYYAVARVGGQFLESAFTGAALLVGLALPVFAAASLLFERRRRRRENTGEGPAQCP
jgi:hypothetical protein